MNILHLIFGFLVVAIWGFNIVVIKVGLDDIPPLLLGFFRLFLTSIPAIFFIKRPKVGWGVLCWYGLMMFTFQFGFLFTGMDLGVSPALASLLIQLQVFFTMLLGVLFVKEKIDRYQLIGALVAFGGIAYVAFNVGADVSWWGFFFIIAAAMAWAGGNLISKRIGKVNMVSLVAWGSLFAWPPLLALSFMVEGQEKILSSIQHLSWLSTGAVLYITYLATLFAYGVWSLLLHHHPLSRIAPLGLLLPVCGIMCSVLVLDEPLQNWKILASGLIITGLFIHLFGPKLALRWFKKEPSEASASDE